jgi:hypothetical protein
MTTTLNGKFKIGEPNEYESVYGYQKQRFPVLNEQGSEVGAIKEELVMDGAGNVVAKMYYTRNLTRPHGAKRFYDSPQALILAFGGTIDRTVALPLVKVKRGKQKPVEHETVEQAEIAQEPGEQEPVETSAD